MSGAVDQQFSQSSNEFASDLYQKTIEGNNGNVIISPISIQTATSLAMFGAAGETKAEMMRGLKYPLGSTDDSIAKNFKAFTETVKKTNGLSIGMEYEVTCMPEQFIANVPFIFMLQDKKKSKVHFIGRIKNF